MDLPARHSHRCILCKDSELFPRISAQDHSPSGGGLDSKIAWHDSFVLTGYTPKIQSEWHVRWELILRRRKKPICSKKKPTCTRPKNTGIKKIQICPLITTRKRYMWIRGVKGTCSSPMFLIHFLTWKPCLFNSDILKVGS